MNDIKPIELTVDALIEAAQSFAAGDHEQPMSIAQIRAERRRYVDEAKARAKELKELALRKPPLSNPSRPMRPSSRASASQPANSKSLR